MQTLRNLPLIFSILLMCANAFARNSKADYYAQGDPSRLKISTHLLRAESDEKSGTPLVATLAKTLPGAVRDNAVQLNVAVSAVSSELIKTIEALGIRILESHPAERLMIVHAQTMNQVLALARLDEVIAIIPEYGYITFTGSALSQGDAAMFADAARARTGATGAGVRVGVISDTLNRRVGGTISGGILTGSNPQNSGDLPAQVRLIGTQPTSGIDEGAAMLEIIHDVAPGAELYFASGTISQPAFASNIRSLVNAGVDVIVDDILWFGEPMYQDGPIAVSADFARSRNVPYFSAAGNFGDNAYASPFVDSNASVNNTTYPPSGADLHDFGGGDRFLTLHLPSGASVNIVLQWNEPFANLAPGPGSAADLDLYLLRNTNTPIQRASIAAESSGFQGDLSARSGDPVEFINFTNTGAAADFQICIDRSGDPPNSVSPSAMSVVVYFPGDGFISDTQFLGYSNIFGHAAAEGASSIGAIFWAEINDQTDPIGEIDPPSGQWNVEYYSSVGGALPFYYDANGLPLANAPIYRLKPDFTAPDGGDTSFFGQQIGDGNSFPNFFGTSAAAPHAAAVAALMLQRVPTLTPDQIRAVITETALDIEIPGFDVLSGYGYVDAEFAVTSVPNGGRFVGSTIPADMLTSQKTTAEIAVKNIGTSSWTRAANFGLEILSDPCGLMSGAARAPLPEGVTVSPGSTHTFSITLQAPAQPGTCSLQIGLIQEFVERFSLPMTRTINVGQAFTQEFPNLDSGWAGFVVTGGGSVALQPEGLCMNTPLTGNNIHGWISPEAYAPLVDRRVLRIRATMNTDQTQPEAIPLWDIIYDNFNSSGFGGVYGGETIFIDVSGGANGVGRPQGRTQFECYAMPLAAETPQWRGTLPAGDNSNGAFVPFRDPYNDLRIGMRMLDLDGAGVNAQIDSGRVCLASLRLDGIPLDALQLIGVPWAPAINTATHLAQSSSQAAENAGSASIDNGVGAVLYQLNDGSGLGGRKTLLPFDEAVFAGGSGSLNASLYPVIWESGALYRGVMTLLSAVGGGVGAEGTDPIDAIFVNSDTPTNEVVNIHFTLRGSPPDNFFLAGSPRLSATAGGQPQRYSSFFFAHNATIVDLNVLPDANRFRFLGDFFNTTNIGIDGVGANPLWVMDFRIERYQPIP